jgi:hypothetical protein
MMGFPEGWTDGTSRREALKALGNAVVPQQGAAALHKLSEGGKRIGVTGKRAESAPPSDYPLTRPRREA